MVKRVSRKTKVQKVETGKEKNLNGKPFQIKMEAQVHQLLKERAQQQKIPIGAFIQNLLASLESRLERYKVKYDFGEKMRNEKVDAKLIKFLTIKDTRGLSPEEIEFKINQIKTEFASSGYRPNIRLNNGDL
jgi:hypothetical protein